MLRKDGKPGKEILSRSVCPQFGIPALARVLADQTLP
jgi:hypothetical protein